MMNSTPPSRRRDDPEGRLQTAIMRQISQHGRRDAFVAAIPNGGNRSTSEAMRFKNQGVCAGVPDLMVLVRGTTRFLELKAPGKARGSRQGCSDAQLYTHRIMREAGAVIEIADSLEGALALLTAWGVFDAEPRPEVAG